MGIYVHSEAPVSSAVAGYVPGSLDNAPMCATHVDDSPPKSLTIKVLSPQSPKSSLTAFIVIPGPGCSLMSYPGPLSIMYILIIKNLFPVIKLKEAYLKVID